MIVSGKQGLGRTDAISKTTKLDFDKLLQLLPVFVIQLSA